MTPFGDFDAYLDLSRVSGLHLSPDGERLVVGVSGLDEKRTAFTTAVWELDPAGERPARRITWGPRSESPQGFLPDGTLLLSTRRTGPGAGDADADEPAALWALPPEGGEARPFASRPGGIDDVAVAADAGTVVLSSSTLSTSKTLDDETEGRKTRKDLKLNVLLHDAYPVRFWDHELGPGHPRLFTGEPVGGAWEYSAEPPLELRDLTGPVAPALSDGAEFDVSRDGTTIVASWWVAEPGGSGRFTLVAIDVATGERRTLLDDPDYEYASPRISPDGRKVAVVAEHRPGDEGQPVAIRLLVLHLSSGDVHDAAPGWDRWGGGAVWTPDGSALLVAADEAGRAPVFRLDLDLRTATRLTGDHGAYTDLRLSADGTRLYALRSAIDAAPAPVRLDPTLPDQAPVVLRAPHPAPALPGDLVEIEVPATADAPALRAWLARPTGASAEQPAPLLLWVHGGPLGSWNAWSWRWNPWLAVAQGYAVLLPDPALSTGYGQAFIDRGWGRWGTASYGDVMTLTDAAVARDDVDGERTAAMGGSYGGYMANWIAGHTDRFRGIVSHAGIWCLDQFGPTTDAYYYWRREMSADMLQANSPDRAVASIRTPMLVIHGDKDYRVPVGEALRLWAELAEHNDPADPLPHRFLLFPDENHWVLKPQHAKLWYATVFAFLAHTVHGRPWEAPELLA